MGTACQEYVRSRSATVLKKPPIFASRHDTTCVGLAPSFMVRSDAHESLAFEADIVISARKNGRKQYGTTMLSDGCYMERKRFSNALYKANAV